MVSALCIAVALMSATVAAQPATCTNTGHDHCDAAAHDFAKGWSENGGIRVSENGGLGRLEVHGDAGAVLQKDEGIVAILDLSKPTRPKVLGRYADDAQQSLDGDLAFSKDGRWVFYARQTVNFSRDGLHVIDVSAPENPRLAFYQPLGGASRVLYHQDEAGEWVVVLDAVAGLVVNRFEPTTGVLVPVFASVDPVAKVGGPASAGLALENGPDGALLFVTTGRTGLEIYDFADPASPELAGAWNEEESLAEVEVVTRKGRRSVYLATEYWFDKTIPPQVVVLDATDIGSIREVDRWDVGAGAEDLWRLQGMDVMGDLLVAAHSHAGLVAFDPEGRQRLRSDAYGAARAPGSAAPGVPFAYDVETMGRWALVTDAASGWLSVLRRG